LIVQVPLTATVERQLLVWVKLPLTAPGMLILLIVRFAVPVLVNVKLMGIEVVPLERAGNTSAEVERETAAAPPLPISSMVCVSPLISSVAVAYSVTEPVWKGWKAIARVQTCVRLAGQVEPSVKTKLLGDGSVTLNE